jgi:DNA-binding CsgD family transcriptional regulator
MLAVLGLTEQDEAVLEALIRRNQASAADLSVDCGLNEPAVRRTATTLVRRGLARRMPGRVARYAAVSPDTSIEALILEQEGAIRDVRMHMYRLMGAFRAGARFANPDDLVETVSGRDEVNDRWEQLQRGARHEVCTFDLPPYAMDDPFLTPNTLEQEILAKGISYRAVYDHAAMELPGWLHHVTAAVRAGEKARVAPRLPMKLALADGVLAMIPLLRTGDREVTASYVIHPSPILDALTALFESVWSGSAPVRLGAGVAPDRGPADLDPDESRLMTLLASGLSDSAAGRVLGWSERTVQRRVVKLMDRLGVRTRLQLGIEAARTGWV